MRRELVELFRPAIDEGRHDHAGRDRLVTHHNLLDRLPVDRHVHGAADAHIGKRVLALDIVAFKIVGTLLHAEENLAAPPGRYPERVHPG